MSERGVFAVDRGIWEHECFADEPFTEREAWIWLCGEANWKAKSRRVKQFDVKLARGQLVASLRFLAEKWKWKKDAVARFLTRIEKRDMIATTSETGITVITIRNYNEYQRVSLPSATVAETESATATRQQRDKAEDIKTIEIDSEAKASDAVASPPIYEDSTHELWHEGVAILIQLGLSDKNARSNIGRWLRDAKSDATKVLGAIQRARDARTRDPIAFVTGCIKTGTKSRNRGGFLDLALEIGENEHQPHHHTLISGPDH